MVLARCIPLGRYKTSSVSPGRESVDNLAARFVWPPSQLGMSSIIVTFDEMIPRCRYNSPAMAKCPEGMPVSFQPPWPQKAWPDLAGYSRGQQAAVPIIKEIQSKSTSPLQIVGCPDLAG